MKIVALIFSLLLLLGSCLKGESGRALTEESKSDKYTMNFLHGNTPDSTLPHQKAAIFLKNFIESKSDGKIEVQIYALGQLGDGPDVFPQLVRGSLAATFQAMRAFTGFIPEVQAFEIPYSFPNPEVMSKFLESPITEYLNEKVTEAFPGITLTGIALFGYRQWMTSIPVKQLADLKGIKIRSIPSPLHELFYKNLGMVPVSVPWPDVYSAFSTNLVSGIDQPFSDAIGISLPDFTKYAYADNNIFHGTVWLLSDAWLATIPQNLRSVVIEGLDRARIVFKEAILEGEQKYLKEFENAGGTVTYLKDSDIEQTKAEAKRLQEWFLNEYPRSGQEMYETIQENIAWAQRNNVTKDAAWANSY